MNEAAEQSTLLAQLREFTGKSVQVGQCALVADSQNNLIWLVDAYGMESIAARGLTEAHLLRALEVAAKANDDRAPHPAESGH